MGKKPSLFVVERVQIVALRMERIPEGQKTKRLQSNKWSVHRTIEKFKKREVYDECFTSIFEVALQWLFRNNLEIGACRLA